MSTLLDNSYDHEIAQSELARFESILKRHVLAQSVERAKLRQVLVQYVKFSPNASDLINSLILSCISMKCPERLDIAIDILSQLDHVIVSYANNYLDRDMKQWKKLYPYEDKKFRPNDDFWFVLLRSVGKSKAKSLLALRVISACQDETSRGVAEAVVEALGDLGTSEARSILAATQQSHPDPFVKELAAEILEGLDCAE